MKSGKNARRGKRPAKTKSALGAAKPLAKIATRIAGVDEILDGGLPSGRTTLVSGGPGSGKSVFGLEFLYRGAADGEAGLYVTFEERVDAVRQNALTFGWDLEALEQANKLFVMEARLDPEVVVSGDFNLKGLLALIGGKAEEMGATRIVIDAISSCARMGTKQIAFAYVMRLVNACKERGITSVLINQTEGFQEQQEISGVGISSLIDTVLFMRYIDHGGEINRMLLVMKSRGSKHTNQYREFLITNDGIDVVDVYVGEEGVLTGVARQEQEAKDAAEARRSQRVLALKERDVARMRKVIEAQTAKLNAELGLAEAELESLQVEAQTVQKGRDERRLMRGEDADGTGMRERPPQGKRKGAQGKRGAK